MARMARHALLCLLRWFTLARAGAAPLRVYLLFGQSNMEGHGITGDLQDALNGTLAYAAQNPRPSDWPVCDVTKAASFQAGCDGAGADFAQLVDGPDGKTWRTNEAVWVDSYGDGPGGAWGTVRRGALMPGFGFDGVGHVGPELGFGTEIGKDNGALLIKVSWGGTALAKDWRPPSSGGEVGWCYGNATAYALNALKNLSTVFPGYDADRGHVLAGWVWHHGWNDGCSDEQAAEYEFNLANLIKDVDAALRFEARGAPLRVVVAVQGTGGGWIGQSARRLEVIRAQYNVSTYTEFAGRVAAVETRGFWRRFDETQGACDQGYHWNCNAASYFWIGTAAGQAMGSLEAGTWSQPFINASNARDAPVSDDAEACVV
ncbi:SGNH hydrolase-type esterase domain-containing protein [Pelagophyceae sp. CCMP2097]|nr:SGNH hydrolase-type esterase domain-containing protein [Pelagophyceae sp. CCMP2097]